MMKLIVKIKGINFVMADALQPESKILVTDSMVLPYVDLHASSPYYSSVCINKYITLCTVNEEYEVTGIYSNFPATEKGNNVMKRLKNYIVRKVAMVLYLAGYRDISSILVRNTN